MMKAAILILAGGGGHTSIAVALAQNLREKTKITFLVPRNDWLSEKLLKGYGEVGHLVKPRDPFTPNYLFLLRFPLALIQSFFKVKRGFCLVISCGSNFCIAPALVAWLKGIPVINIESRVALKKHSKTARLLKPFSALTILQWEEQADNLEGVVSGPIFPRPEFEPQKRGYILVTGGTQGHKKLFDAISDSDINDVVLQTGKVDPEPYRRKHPEWKVFSLTVNFQEILAGADVVVTHQGGGTIYEAIIYKKPLIIVHNPELKRTANEEDMRLLAKKVNAKYLTEVNTNKIIEAIKEMEEYTPLDFPDGTENVTKLILNILHDSNSLK